MLNCHKLRGTFSKPITVQTNDPKHSSVTLTCKGQILEAVKLSPTLLNFGRIAPDEDSKETKVVITRGNAGPIKPVLRPMNDPKFKIELREVEPGEKYELVGTAHPGPTDRNVRGKIVLDTGVSEQPTVDLTMYGTVSQRVTARPGVVVVPSDANTNWEQTVSFAWLDGSAHELLEADSDFPKLDASITHVQGQPRVVVRLKEPLDGKPIPPRTAVHVTTDDPKAKTVDIPIQYRKPRPRPGHRVNRGRSPAVQPLNPKRKPRSKAQPKLAAPDPSKREPTTPAHSSKAGPPDGPAPSPATTPETTPATTPTNGDSPPPE